MRHVVCDEFGPPGLLRLADAADPRPGPGEVLIAVRAAGVSFVDTLMVAGGYQLTTPPPFTPGVVSAGVVLATGESAAEERAGQARAGQGRAGQARAGQGRAGQGRAGQGRAGQGRAGLERAAQGGTAGTGPAGCLPGQRVVGCSFALGGYATHRVLPAAALAPVPGGVPDEVAATAVESYATMLFALTERTQVRPGEWVLVLGAGGGIGLAAVDVACALGARVIAAAATPAKRAAAVAAGATASIDYTGQDLKARVREVTGDGADLVIDPVGAPYAEPALRSLRGGGRYLVVGFAGGTIPRLPANRVLLDNRTVAGVDWGAWSRHDPAAARDLTTALLARVAAGELHPVAPACHPLEQAPQVLASLAARQVTGKLALIPEHPGEG